MDFERSDYRRKKMECVLICLSGALSSYDIIGLQAPGYEGALTVAIINQIQDRDRIVNSAAHQYCDNYNKYKDSKCCDGEGRMVSDPYIPKACDMCHKFVDKYSENGKVIKPVECVAECLSEAEAGMQKIVDEANHQYQEWLKEAE